MGSFLLPPPPRHLSRFTLIIMIIINMIIIIIMTLSNCFFVCCFFFFFSLFALFFCSFPLSPPHRVEYNGVQHILLFPYVFFFDFHWVFFEYFFCPAFITLVTNEYTRWKVAFLCL